MHTNQRIPCLLDYTVNTLINLCKATTHYSASAPSPASVPAPHPTSLSSDSIQPLQRGMTWNRRFASPVYGIASADLNNDGLEELVVTTEWRVALLTGLVGRETTSCTGERADTGD